LRPFLALALREQALLVRAGAEPGNVARVRALESRARALFEELGMRIPQQTAGDVRG
jgi:hypothetical protein